MTNNTMSTHIERRGFAIPTALLVISVLTIMVAGGFSIVSAERRSVADQKSQVSAFRIAEQGLEVYLIRRDSMITAGSVVCSPAPCQRVPGDSDRVQITVPGGVAQVSLTRIRSPRNNQSGLYVARSMGTETTGAYAGTPQGVRTVAQYVLWQPAPMQVLAGWTALNGIRVNGNSATIGGIDLCGQADTVAGVDVPINPGYSGKAGSGVKGDPPVDTVENMADSVHIDWNSIVNQNSITPSIVIPGGSFPSAQYFTAHPDYYPVIRVNLPDYTLPNSGQGMIISTGNLTIDGSSTWKGVLLVGGDITSNGTNGIQGATVSGLNIKLGTYVPSSTANGTKSYNFNSCEVSKATTSNGALVTLRNTWVDNWVQYN
jgi:Tfp pilus assembly protein PilX